jgi:hypothetical protein
MICAHLAASPGHVKGSSARTAERRSQLSSTKCTTTPRKLGFGFVGPAIECQATLTPLECNADVSQTQDFEVSDLFRERCTVRSVGTKNGGLRFLIMPWKVG